MQVAMWMAWHTAASRLAETPPLDDVARVNIQYSSPLMLCNPEVCILLRIDGLSLAA